MAIRPVVVSFQAEGVRDVTRSFQTIAAAAANAEKASLRSHDRVANQAVRSYNKTTEAKKRETKASLTEDEKLVQSKQRITRQIEAIERRQSERRMREVEREVKAAIKADDDRVRAAKRASDQIEKIRAKESAASQRIGNAIGRTVGGSVRGVIGGASRLATTAMAVGGGFSIVDSLQSTIANRGKAAEIALNSGGDLKRDDLLKQAHEIATSRGFEGSQILAGIDRFGATSGDYKNAPKVIDQIAALANATGGNVDELASAAGLFQANGGDAAKTQEWLRVTAGMGRAGSVDVRDLAQHGSKVSSASGAFGNQSAAFVDLSAMTQMAVKKGGAADAAEATTAIARFSGDIWKNEDALKAMGVKTRDSSGKKLSSVEGIMTDAISASKGERGKLGDVWKLESIKSVEGYRQIYNDAAASNKLVKGSTAASQDAAGRAAIAKSFEDMRKAVLSETQVREEAAKRMEETDKKLIAVFEKLKVEVGDKLAPKFMELIPVLEKAIPAFTSMLDFAAKNPFESVALLMGAAVAKDIAAAGIGKGIEYGVSRAATAIASGGMGIQTSLGSVSIVIAAAAFALQKGIEHIDAMFKKKTDDQNSDSLAGGTLEEKRAALFQKVRSGNASAADVEQAKRDLASAESGLNEQGKRLDPENKSLTEKLVGGMGQGAIGKWMGMDEAMATEDKAARSEFSRTKQSIEDFKKAIELTTKALQENAANGGGGSPGGKGNAGSPSRNGAPQTDPSRDGHK